ncbi:phospholipase D-like protein [Phytophthora cinnamomi]|uniref:phospholipase D-like protein n=1 Tax=Phytophthora cinnamomi TaxID=4785 RepID=UPI0035595CFB|nr:phospholipase D-like protein [Phytophthora cinnamomi]
MLSTLLRIVRGTTRTLIITIYCFSDETLVAEVVAAANRGVKVKFYLDYKLVTMYSACPVMFIENNKIEVTTAEPPASSFTGSTWWRTSSTSRWGRRTSPAMLWKATVKMCCCTCGGAERK